MDDRTRNLFIGTLIAVVVVVAGAALLFSGNVNNDHATVGTDATGVIVAVDSAGLSDVRGFTLRTDDGDLLEFSLERLENGAEFPPGHFAEHQATAEPVLVRYNSSSGVLFALRVEDAPKTGAAGY